MNQVMNEQVGTLNVASHLKGRAVLKSDTGEKLGEVEDVIINPVAGEVLGIALRLPEGASAALAVQDFIIGPDAVMVAAGKLNPTLDTSNILTGGVKASAIIGAAVVTEDGKLLGRVNEIHIFVKRTVVVYQVAESTLQRFFGGGFFLAGHVPLAISHDGARLIVPVETESRYARTSLIETGDEVREAGSV